MDTLIILIAAGSALVGFVVGLIIKGLTIKQQQFSVTAEDLFKIASRPNPEELYKAADIARALRDKLEGGI